jgi:hypothetical protein
MAKGIVPKITVTVADDAHIVVSMKPVSGQKGIVPLPGNALVGANQTITIESA